ncbi:40S ribosomal protein S21 [Larimichthys crocea]|uniref:Uncharacterized protein n=1 Tax=Larimichthys crocea TaxID=215358 RepID=A0ACD3RBB9_LARCR|nr:40S ribosomal protein S21 [Larimichthys crocea]
MNFITYLVSLGLIAAVCSNPISCPADCEETDHFQQAEFRHVSDLEDSSVAPWRLVNESKEGREPFHIWKAECRDGCKIPNMPNMVPKTIVVEISVYQRLHQAHPNNTRWCKCPYELAVGLYKERCFPSLLHKNQELDWPDLIPIQHLLDELIKLEVTNVLVAAGGARNTQRSGFFIRVMRSLFPVGHPSLRFVGDHLYTPVNMQNDAGEFVDLYVPRKCSASNRIIGAKDHASIQINIAEVDKVTGRFNGQFKTYAICGAIRRMGESDDSILRLAKNDSVVAKNF